MLEMEFFAVFRKFLVHTLFGVHRKKTMLDGEKHSEGAQGLDAAGTPEND
jgi:hypothetical protein